MDIWIDYYETAEDATRAAVSYWNGLTKNEKGNHTVCTEKVIEFDEDGEPITITSYPCRFDSEIANDRIKAIAVIKYAVDEWSFDLAKEESEELADFDPDD